VQTSELLRRILAGAAIATLVSLPLADVARAGVGGTDTDTDGGGSTDTDTDTDTVGVTTTSTTRVVVNTTATTARGVGSGSLANTGEDLALPATLAGGGLVIALGARRVARSRSVG
jgi:hypothetical protein